MAVADGRRSIKSRAGKKREANRKCDYPDDQSLTPQLAPENNAVRTPVNLGRGN